MVGPSRSCPAPLWPALLLAGVLAAWIDLGDYHRWHCSDSLVPVLTSLYRWTPFFWGCSRIGMLVPLLAMPFQHPLANLLVQCWLVLFAALATLVLLPRYLLRDGSWPLPAAAAALVFLGLLPDGTHFYFTFGQPHYVVSFALGLAGALLVSERRSAGWLALAFLLFLLASWVNSAAPLFLGPLVLLRGMALSPSQPAGSWRWRDRFDRESQVSLALVMGAGLVLWLVQHGIAGPGDPALHGLLSLRRWPGAWGRLGLNTLRATGPAFFLAPALSAAGGLGLAWHRRMSLPLRPCLVLAGGAAVYMLGMGMLKWVSANQHDCRYAIPAVLCCLSALSILALPFPLPGSRQARGLVAGLLVLLLIGTAAWRHGLPSLGRVRAEVAGWHTLGTQPPQPVAPLAEQVCAARCSHVTGSYWSVWPTVFAANLALHEQGDRHTVWGVTERSEATRDLWAPRPDTEVRLAVLTAQDRIEPATAAYLAEYFPGLAVGEKYPGLWVLERPARLTATAPSR